MNYDVDIAGLWATLGMFIIMVLLVVGAVMIFYLIGLWHFFKKAGKNGWEAIVPFYNSWILVEISGLSWWYFLLIISNIIANFLGIDGLDTLCNLASIFASFLCYYNISKKLHKDVGFAILMTLFPVIMIPMIGFSNNYQFDDTVVVSENGPFAGKESNTTKSSFQSNPTDSQSKFCPHCGNKLDMNSKFCGNCGKEINS